MRRVEADEKEQAQDEFIEQEVNNAIKGLKTKPGQ
jgi:hypothetical protein